MARSLRPCLKAIVLATEHACCCGPACFDQICKAGPVFHRAVEIGHPDLSLLEPRDGALFAAVLES